MSRRSGITTQALFAHAAKHARLEKYLAQGSRRAIERSAKAAVDAKARALKSHYNLGKTEFRGLNKIKRKIRLRATTGRNGTTITERLSAPSGIPLRDYGARFTKKGVSFSIVKGKRHFLQSGFRNEELGGSHVFRRARVGSGKLAGRLPIEKRFGPGLPYLIQNREVAYKGRQAFERRVPEELRKEDERARRRAGLK